MCRGSDNVRVHMHINRKNVIKMTTKRQHIRTYTHTHTHTHMLQNCTTELGSIISCCMQEDSFCSPTKDVDNSFLQLMVGFDELGKAKAEAVKWTGDSCIVGKVRVQAVQISVPINRCA